MSKSLKDMPRYIRREIAARRMIRMKANDFYKQYCDKLRARLREPLAAVSVIISYKELCALWPPDNVKAYFGSRAYRWDCHQNELHNYGAGDWWQCFLNWLDTSKERESQ